MELGLGVLRISPQDFWRMSLTEWMAARDGVAGASGQGAGAGPVMAQELARLMTTFPDRKK